MVTNFKKECIKVLSNIRPCSTFLGIRGYTNNSGEVSDYNICFHVDYQSALKRAIKILESFDVKSEEIADTSISHDDINHARIDLLNSFRKSLLETKGDKTFKSLKDSNNNTIPGAKLHKKNNIIYIQGILLNKKVISPGDQKAKKDTVKTGEMIAKEMLRDKTSISKFVQFKLDPDRFDKLIVEKMVLEP